MNVKYQKDRVGGNIPHEKVKLIEENDVTNSNVMINAEENEKKIQHENGPEENYEKSSDKTVNESFYFTVENDYFQRYALICYLFCSVYMINP